jgi:hypothetical protein
VHYARPYLAALIDRKHNGRLLNINCFLFKNNKVESKVGCITLISDMLQSAQNYNLPLPEVKSFDLFGKKIAYFSINDKKMACLIQVRIEL